MVARLALAAVLLGPTLALAGGTITPPKGWIRDKAYEEKTRPQLLKQLGEGATVVPTTWRATDNGGDPSLHAQLMTFADGQELEVEALLKDMATALEPKLLKAGFTAKPVTAPQRKGTTAIARAWEGQGKYLHIAILAMPGPKKSLTVYAVQCFEETATKQCDKAVGSMKLTK